ncbi:MAG: hypothetical protein A3H88_00025 [Candidatus Blackburnbacteria bacterium RIFCSPLOWO2_02_FULL_44_9]|uniref:Uncharacterized protein n=1 Tax=Candidatus Blackburnbacteria bacterium RIFCSPHIGHO2_02_FULL_44_20 TaxID=1797516 RepID=A0A1G1V734_9BACT|nr:MAG: hypothetical protein A3E16_03560 [Candidatus Blackburnbacteria bacterium RIFCSPHIGHO2_12_FULL_44_25]OGY11225.1 MAG: hypothetical protein A3D26_04265 [Candidatus Blackburnbacteria bacterium RIFCSPHIGHO2_02_FULL_44_20]OGY17043.1 MAG: hypothetical protein A3H88_00025 [Candidatus Blackburnbacteria bacterium RIFCSPLOWO2_02_FULL_44_9]
MKDSDVRFVFVGLPQDARKLARLVEVIPDGWSGLTGRLDIIPEMALVAVPGVGYRFKGISGLECDVVGAREGGYRVEPDYMRLVSGRDPVSFVEFYLHNPYAACRVVDRARAVAAAVVESGYRGELSFRLDDNRQNTKAVVHFFLNPPEGRVPHIIVRLIDRSVDGLLPEDEECIMPFVDACRAQGLQEQVLVPA